ncbi:MAG: hypothetical protein LBJ46_09005 [Planctomycetota bacterium]|jgi:hypothetical protein|nr:hypothetical protein [Planctomycetota bacterium]
MKIVGREYQVLPNPDKPTFQGGTVPFLRHVVEPDLLPLTYRTTDIHRMGVYDEKGGSLLLIVSGHFGECACKAFQ